jgi:uncharacterized membrane protein
MAVKLAEVDERCLENSRKLEAMSKQFEALNRMATAMEVMATKQTHQAEKIDEMKESVNRLNEKVDAIEKKPGKRWDSVVDKFLCGLVGALAAAMFAGIVYLLTVAA